MKSAWLVRAAAGLLLVVCLSAQTPPAPLPAAVRLHGVVEPVHSYTVSTPRMTGGGPGPGQLQLIIVHLADAGSLVRKGDLLVEFDRTTQLRTVRDREAEHLDIQQQINRRRGEHVTAQALRDTQLKQAGNDLAIARLGVVGNDTIGSIAAEKNRQTLEEAEARLKQLTRTFDLRQRAEAADMRILQIQQERALNAGSTPNATSRRCASRRRSTAWSSCAAYSARDRWPRYARAKRFGPGCRFSTWWIHLRCAYG